MTAIRCMKKYKRILELKCSHRIEAIERNQRRRRIENCADIVNVGKSNVYLRGYKISEDVRFVMRIT